MGNEIRIEVLGNSSIMSKNNYLEIKKLLKGGDGNFDESVQRLRDGTVKIFAMSGSGTHGTHKVYWDKAGIYRPLRGVMQVDYFDFDAPQHLTRKVGPRKAGKVIEKHDFEGYYDEELFPQEED